LSISQENATKFQRETDQRTQNTVNAQLRDKDNIISSLERQYNAAKEELKALQTTYDNSNNTMKTYREKLLSAS
jgi:hypothetical protein